MVLSTLDIGTQYNSFFPQRPLLVSIRMTLFSGFVSLYLLTFIVLPEKGENLQRIFTEINNALSDRQGATFKFKLKVNGERKAIAAVEITNVCVLEEILESIFFIASIKTICEPVITVEDLGRQLGVPEKLIPQDKPTLGRENIFYLDCTYDYYGNTTEELLDVVKATVVDYLKLKAAGQYFGQAYKNVAERRLQSFVNARDIVKLETLISQLPIPKDLGSNVHKYAKGMQFLDHYVGVRNVSGRY